jgi:GNAT superfamily N-acetyltransferase
MLDGPRGARPEELAGVLALVNAVFTGEDMGAAFPTLFHPDNAQWLRTFWDGGTAVAHVGVWLGRIWSRGRPLAVAHVGAVCTRPEYRRQGLAGALLADALPRLRSAGVGLLLISGDRSLYRRLGARPFGRLLRYRIAREQAGAAESARLAVAAPDPRAAAAEMAALYDQEPVRYARAPAEWAALLPAKGYVPPARGLAAATARRLDGTLAAYLLLGRVRQPRPEEQAPAVLPVHEFAGERAAVLAALRAALDAAAAEVAELLVQPGDGHLRRLLEDRGLVPEACRHQGTARALRYEACAAAFGLAPPAALPPLGSAGEADLAARWTAALTEANELPRNDGLNYI